MSCSSPAAAEVSIHAPAKEATEYYAFVHRSRNQVSIHAPAKEATALGGDGI